LGSDTEGSGVPVPCRSEEGREGSNEYASAGGADIEKKTKEARKLRQPADKGVPEQLINVGRLEEKRGETV